MISKKSLTLVFVMTTDGFKPHPPSYPLATSVQVDKKAMGL